MVRNARVIHGKKRTGAQSCTELHECPEGARSFRSRRRVAASVAAAAAALTLRDSQQVRRIGTTHAMPAFFNATVTACV